MLEGLELGFDDLFSVEGVGDVAEVEVGGSAAGDVEVAGVEEALEDGLADFDGFDG